MVEGNLQNQLPNVKVIAEPEGPTKKDPKDLERSKVGDEDLDRSKIDAQDLGRSQNGADDLKRPKVDAEEVEVVDIDYFRCSLINQTSRLQELCSRWQNVDDIPHHWTGEVRSTVGKAKLLVSERFHQFSGLVDDCQFCRGEKKTTCQDLNGFWDMVFLQVEEIIESFERLEGAKEKGWPEQVQEEDTKAPENKVAKVKVVVPRRKVTAGKSNIKAMIAARRAELAGKSPGGGGLLHPGGGAAGLLHPGGGAGLLHPHQDVKTFEGGFFNIASPMGKPKVSPRCSNRAALFGRKLHNLPDLSPLAKVSAQVKHCLEKTTRTRLFLETDDIEATSKQIPD